MENKPEINWKKYRGRLIGIISAFLFSLLWVTIGFPKTVLVFVIVGIGYLVGSFYDGELDVNAWLRYFFR